jgi:hypothetical protein
MYLLYLFLSFKQFCLGRLGNNLKERKWQRRHILLAGIGARQAWSLPACAAKLPRHALQKAAGLFDLGQKDVAVMTGSQPTYIPQSPQQKLHFSPPVVCFCQLCGSCFMQRGPTNSSYFK